MVGGPDANPREVIGQGEVLVIARRQSPPVPEAALTKRLLPAPPLSPMVGCSGPRVDPGQSRCCSLDCRKQLKCLLALSQCPYSPVGAFHQKPPTLPR